MRVKDVGTGKTWGHSVEMRGLPRLSKCTVTYLWYCLHCYLLVCRPMVCSEHLAACSIARQGKSSVKLMEASERVVTVCIRPSARSLLATHKVSSKPSHLPFVAANISSAIRIASACKARDFCASSGLPSSFPSS